MNVYHDIIYSLDIVILEININVPLFKYKSRKLKVTKYRLNRDSNCNKSTTLKRTHIAIQRFIILELYMKNSKQQTEKSIIQNITIVL